MVFGVAAIGVVKCYYDAYRCVHTQARRPARVTVALWFTCVFPLPVLCVSLYGGGWGRFRMRSLACLRVLETQPRNSAQQTRPGCCLCVVMAALSSVALYTSTIHQLPLYIACG